MTRNGRDAVRVTTTRGRTVLLDPEVAARIAGRAISDNGRYPTVQLGGRTTYLHHLVLGVPPCGLVTDHINNNPYDARRRNLRHVSQSVNRLRALRARAATAFAGAKRHRGLWHARMGWRRRWRSNGYYHHPVLAALARDDLVERVARVREGLNFPLRIRRADLPGFFARATDDLRVWFVKRSDGSIRELVGRTATAEVPLPFDPARRGLLLVQERPVGVYRFIPLEGVLCLTYRDKRFRVVQ